MQPSLNHILDRTTRLRRQLEQERRHAGARPSRLLRLQALLLRAQKHLADMIAPENMRAVPVVASSAGSRTQRMQRR